MRRNQLTFKIESFGDQAVNGTMSEVSGYIDGNNIAEVMHDTLAELHKIYNKDMSFDDFINQIKDFDTEHRFGRTQVTIYGITDNFKKTRVLLNDINLMNNKEC